MAWPRMVGGDGVNITLYRFTKRENSTKLPTANDQPIIYSCRLNDSESSLLNPVLKLSAANAQTNLLNRNYVYIPEFGRYYYIDDWRYDGDGCWSALCRIDPLASWKTQIIGSGGYTSRVQGYKDPYLVDSLFPPTEKFVVVTQTYQTYLDPSLAGGSFIIGVISKNAPNVGAVAYYLITAAQLEVLVNNMLSSTNSSWSSVTKLDSDVLKSLVDPMQYVVSCKWFPFELTITGTSERIYLGGWDSGATGSKLITPYHQIYDLILGLQDVTDQYTDATTVYEYTHNQYPPFPPYGEYSLITPWGTFELDPTVMAAVYTQYATAATRSMSVRLMANLVSGQATMIVLTDVKPTENVSKTYELFRREIDFALDIPLAQVSMNYLSMAKSGLNAASKAGNVGAWASNPVGNAAAIASDVLDATAAALSPAVNSTSTGNAAFTPLIETITYQMRRFKSIDNSRINLVGGIFKTNISTMQDLAPSGSTFAGYIQMAITDFQAPCKRDEYVAITSALLNGIYIE